MKNAVIVTGAAGFIGFHLAKSYLDQGFIVIGIDNYLTGSTENIAALQKQYAEKFKFFRHDVCEPWLFLNEIKNLNPALVFHFASPAAVNHYQQFSLETMLVNSTGLQRALAAADILQSRLIFASTSEIYGSATVSPQSENYWGNVNSFGERSCYDEAKRFGEALIFTHNKKFKTRHGLVRIFNTYGPRMSPTDGRVVINFILQALKNETITIYGDGNQTRCFCYIDDLIRAILLYANSPIVAPLNIGNNHEITILELAKIVIQKLSSKSTLSFLPIPADDPKQRKPDLTKALELLNYKPHVSLEDGVLKMADWLRSKI